MHALRRNVMRSALTCLGIIIGIASVIAMAEIGQGSSNLMQQTVASMGANQLGISPSSSTPAGVRGLVLGACNGFQALIRMHAFGDDVSIAHNASGRFLNRWANLEPEPEPELNSAAGPASP